MTLTFRLFIFAVLRPVEVYISCCFSNRLLWFDRSYSGIQKTIVVKAIPKVMCGIIWFFPSFIWKSVSSLNLYSSYNPGQKSLGQYCNMHIFPSFLGSFSKFSCSSPSPHPIKSWISQKILDTRVQHCLWGEGRGWTCVNWKTPQKRKCPKTFVHDCSLTHSPLNRPCTTTPEPPVTARKSL